MARYPAAMARAAATVLAFMLAATTVPTASAEWHVTAGSGHVCVVKAGDTVACHSSNTTATAKMTAPAGVKFMAVTAGDAFTYGLVTNGTALCWGTFPGTAPLRATTFIDIHAGAQHLCGLQTNGTVLCYGNATAGVNNVPAGWYQGVSTGSNVACAVGRDHTITCCAMPPTPSSPPCRPSLTPTMCRWVPTMHVISQLPAAWPAGAAMPLAKRPCRLA